MRARPPPVEDYRGGEVVIADNFLQKQQNSRDLAEMAWFERLLDRTARLRDGSLTRFLLDGDRRQQPLR
jgi:hypothetical protein